jgi:hypothetical protein
VARGREFDCIPSRLETARHSPLEVDRVFVRPLRGPGSEANHLEQLVPAERVHINSYALDDALEKLAFLDENVSDALFYRVFDGVRVDVNRLMLAEAVAAIGCLVLHSGIPPAVEVEHIGGGLQVEALATSAE